MRPINFLNSITDIYVFHIRFILVDIYFYCLDKLKLLQRIMFYFSKNVNGFSRSLFRFWMTTNVVCFFKDSLFEIKRSIFAWIQFKSICGVHMLFYPVCSVYCLWCSSFYYKLNEERKVNFWSYKSSMYICTLCCISQLMSFKDNLRPPQHIWVCLKDKEEHIFFCKLENYLQN